MAKRPEKKAAPSKPPELRVLPMQLRSAPGLPAEAGRTVFEGVVAFIDGGVPVVDFGPPAIDERGNVNDLTEMINAVCTALRG